MLQNMATCPPYTWQSERDLSLRKGLIEEIRHLFLDSNSPLISEGGFPEFVKKLELLLYMHARSQVEYMDRSTLVNRLRTFAKQLRGDLCSALPPVRTDSSTFSSSPEFLQQDSGCRVPSYSPPGGSLRVSDGPGGYFEKSLTRDLGGGQLQTDLGVQLQDDPLTEFEDREFMSCSPVPKCQSPQGCADELSKPSLDADLPKGVMGLEPGQDEPFLEDPGFGETWFSFSNEDLLSSEDSICDFDAFSRLPSLTQAPSSPGLQWNSTSTLAMASTPIVEKPMSTDYVNFKTQPPPAFESVPVQQAVGGNGCYRELSNSMGLCPSILPVDAISQTQVKHLGMETSLPGFLSQRMVAPQPLARHLSSISDVQENNHMGSLWNSLLDKSDPLVHAYQCTRGNCDIMCMQLRKLLDHVRRCRLRKKPTNCPSCQWVGLLLSMHAQKCRVKPCPLPCCK